MTSPDEWYGDDHEAARETEAAIRADAAEDAALARLEALEAREGREPLQDPEAWAPGPLASPMVAMGLRQLVEAGLIEQDHADAIGDHVEGREVDPERLVSALAALDGLQTVGALFGPPTAGEPV